MLLLQQVLQQVLLLQQVLQQVMVATATLVANKHKTKLDNTWWNQEDPLCDVTMVSPSVVNYSHNSISTVVSSKYENDP